jgi:hypothetical protein
MCKTAREHPALELAGKIQQVKSPGGCYANAQPGCRRPHASARIDHEDASVRICVRTTAPDSSTSLCSRRAEGHQPVSNTSSWQAPTEEIDETIGSYGRAGRTHDDFE